MKLSEVKIGKTFNIGSHAYIKLDGDDKQSLCVARESVFNSTYGSNNDFSQSNIMKRLNEEILPSIESEVGSENVLEFETDLTSLDGLRTYGNITSKISIPTFDMYRAKVTIFDKYKIKHWWWLATPDSTPEHTSSDWGVCVSPSGDIHFNNGFYNGNGVRPFCILNSNIFVSK